MRRVVVTGIGLITPIGIGKEEFWKNNKDGKSGICDMPELEKFGFESKAYGYVKNFKPEQLGLTLREIRRMDRITQFGVTAVVINRNRKCQNTGSTGALINAVKSSGAWKVVP